MPESVFIQARRDAALTAREREAVNLRDRLIASLPEYASPGPRSASTCYVWPTADCPVGCAHCNFASPRSSAILRRYKVSQHVRQTLDVVNGMGLWKAVLSGGGEPMAEPAFCADFVRNVQGSELEEIELITSCHFATDQRAADAAVADLVKAWRDRPTPRPRLALRISLDWFHAKRLGIAPAARVINTLGKSDYADVNCYIRSVLLDNDETLAQLAKALGGHLGAIVDYQQRLDVPDGRALLVYYKNLILDGRMRPDRLQALPVDLPPEATADTFGKRFQNPEGTSVPARIYNGPSVRHLTGLACVVEDNGAVKILEGNHPRRYPTVQSARSWDHAIRYLYRDPLTVYLVEHGPTALGHLIDEQYPGALHRAASTNQLYYLTDRLLADPAAALWATLRVTELHAADGRLASVDATLARGWQEWRRLADAG